MTLLKRRKSVFLVSHDSRQLDPTLDLIISTPFNIQQAFFTKRGLCLQGTASLVLRSCCK